MTDSEKLDLLLADMQGMKTEMQGMKGYFREFKADVAVLKTDVADLKADVTVLKTDVAELKTDVAVLKTDVAELKTDVAVLKTDVANLQILKKKVEELEIHLENETDRNIQILAENFIELINKLNQAIPAVSKNSLYEMKVDYLVKEMEKLKEKVNNLIKKTA